MRSALLELAGIPKSFGGVQALRAVDFALNAGEITASSARTARAKATLMRIIAGTTSDYEGQNARGRSGKFTSAPRATPISAGIGMVHQELSVAPDLTVAENVFLGVHPVNGLGMVAWRLMARLGTLSSW